MSKTFSVSGQHYLFDVQTFAHTVLAAGGDEYSYALRDRTTQGVIDDVAQGVSELGILLKTSASDSALDEAFKAAGVRYTELVQSAPRVALPSSHPMSNAKSLSLGDLADWPYIYFDQGKDAPAEFAEEAVCDPACAKKIATTDRASLSELCVALNGYTVTSGILVGIADGPALTTVPLETDVTIHLGYITKDGAELSALGESFLSRLKKNLERYVASL